MLSVQNVEMRRDSIYAVRDSSTVLEMCAY